MVRLYQITASLLIAALIFVGQGAAFARGQASPVDQIVLCTGHGTVTIHVDENGTPTAPPQICGDALHNLSAVLDQTPQVSVSRTRFIVRVFEQRDAWALPITHLSKTARAPPLM